MMRFRLGGDTSGRMMLREGCWRIGGSWRVFGVTVTKDLVFGFVGIALRGLRDRAPTERSPRRRIRLAFCSQFIKEAVTNYSTRNLCYISAARAAVPPPQPASLGLKGTSGLALQILLRSDFDPSPSIQWLFFSCRFEHGG